jgi:hypothetical protein
MQIRYLHMQIMYKHKLSMQKANHSEEWKFARCFGGLKLKK